jgi:membrane associated rhomboid family serine protease
VQENAQFTGWAFLSVLILFEVVRLFTPVKMTDHASHIGGFVAGLIGAEMWKRSEDGQEAQKERKKGLRWYEILMGKQIIVDK